MITVLTPTFNRGYIIKKAYESLLRQTDKDFEWLVIDDGSTDNTEKIINSFIKDDLINVRYYKKENGGKHTALNYGFEKASGKYTIILDSDDYLADDAIEIIKSYIDKYEDNNEIACLSFLRIYEDGKTVGREYNGDEIVSDYIEFKHNKGFTGDMAEVYKTKVLCDYPFPVFENERFLSEAIVWNKIALKYKTVFVNKGIYVCEYLNDGLSKNILINRIKSPVGSYENAKLFMNPKFKLSIRLKNSIIYTGFYLIAHKSNRGIFNDVPSRFLIILMYPGGLLFNWYLRFYFKKYGIDKNE